MEAEKVLMEFEKYLSTRVEAKNSARVLPPIRKLLCGAGVTHKNASGAFFKGRALTLDDSIELVRQEAAKWLPYRASDPNILDHGHGWALNHPIQWFSNFKYFRENGVDPPSKRKHVLNTPIKKAKAKTTLAAVSIPKPAPPQPPQPPQQPQPSTAIVAASDEPSLPWPPSREARLASYCGSMLALVTFAKKYGKKGGISTAQVRNWLVKNPGYVPKWLEGQAWEVDHIMSDKFGGLPWPHNYFLLPKSANRHFSTWLTSEKRRYVGEEAWDGAASFARWSRNKTRALVDFADFDPVGAQFIGRA